MCSASNLCPGRRRQEARGEGWAAHEECGDEEVSAGHALAQEEPVQLTRPTHQPNARSATNRQNRPQLAQDRDRSFDSNMCSHLEPAKRRGEWGRAHLAPEHGGDDGCDLAEAGVGSAQLPTPYLVLVHHNPLLHNLRAPTAPAGSTGLSGRQCDYPQVLVSKGGGTNPVS